MGILSRAVASHGNQISTLVVTSSPVKLGRPQFFQKGPLDLPPDTPSPARIPLHSLQLMVSDFVVFFCGPFLPTLSLT